MKRDMKIRKASKIWLAAAAVAPFLAIAAFAERPPNIVFIMVDDMGWADIGVYGSEVTETPNLDRLAENGMMFTDAYAGSALCAPARSTLLTGLHTGRTPVRGNLGGTPIPAGTVTFADVMREAGYTVGGFGKWGIGEIETEGVPEKHGFDVFFGYYHQVHAHSFYPTHLYRNSERIDLPGNVGFDPGPQGGVSHEPRNGREPQYTHYEIFNETVAFIRENKDRPFLCYAPWTPPHFSYHIPEHDPAWELYKDKNWPMDARVHAAMNTMLDRHTGKIVELLEELGIAENTLLVFASDNGAAKRWEGSLNSSGPLRGRKMSLYEGGLRVPFIAYWPGTIEPGQVTGHQTYFPDMLPTFAELGGAAEHVPDDLDGISIVPVLLGAERAGREQESHPFLYFENADNDHRNGRYRWPETLAQAARKDDWKAYREDPEADIELYDLSRDIGEENDLADERPDLIEVFARIFEEESRPLATDQNYNPTNFNK